MLTINQQMYHQTLIFWFYTVYNKSYSAVIT